MIPQKQNDEHALNLLAARQEEWRSAKKLLLVQVSLAVLCPAIAAVASAMYPPIKPYTSIIAVGISLFDVGLIDRLYRARLKHIAKIAEEFDSYVLELPWNQFLVGSKVDQSAIEQAAQSFDRRVGSRAKLHNWYPPILTDVPTHVARLMSQRINLWYDSKVRWIYALLVLMTGISAAAGLSAMAYFQSMALPDFVLSFLVPISPLLLWSAREFARQRETVARQKTLKTEVERHWEGVIDGRIPEVEAIQSARDLQDAIYVRRSSTPLVMPGIYYVVRPILERLMTSGAEKAVERHVKAPD
jgi:hypothetical protein